MKRSNIAVWALLTACSGGTDGAPIGATDNMRWVDGGTFVMGTDSAELDAVRRMTGLTTIRPLLPEVPSHAVTVDGFWMDTVPVTNAVFRAFVATNPKWGKTAVAAAHHNGRYLEHWTAEGPPPNLLRHPVTFITWQAASAYCAWLGKRLPTEAEFEWAAQDGATRAAYPWGDGQPHDSLVNWGGNGIDMTVDVAQYRPNARGLYDMAGNVWQFTSDPWIGSYAEMLQHPDRARAVMADSAIRRVVRGGSWGASAANLRVRYRDSHRPFDAREMVGFRCARS